MIRPKKALGQHFLIDKNIIQKIIKEAKLNSNDIVVEIGPGRGELTFPLADTVAHVFAIEKDKELFFFLKNKLKEKKISNVTLINEDILKWEFAKISPFLEEKKVIVMGSIPYYISSPLIDKLIKSKNIVKRAIIIFQVEFARRLTASPGTKEYGAITLILKYHASVKQLFEISKNVFFPRPKVDSMLVEIKFDQAHPEINENMFNLLVHGAFAYRRKNILNSLSNYLQGKGISMNKASLQQIMKNCKIDPKKRAESLEIRDFLTFTVAFDLKLKKFCPFVKAT